MNNKVLRTYKQKKEEAIDFCRQCIINIKRIEDLEDRKNISEDKAMSHGLFQVESLRYRIYSLICRTPGIHFREIQRRSKLATGQLIYHLRRLLSVSAIRTKKDGKYLRYYTSEKIESEENKIIELTHHESDRNIVLFLLENSHSIHKEVVESIGLSGSTISWHLKKLVNDEIVIKEVMGRKSFYSIREPELVSRVFTEYRQILK